MANSAWAYFNPVGAVVSGLQSGDKWAWDDAKNEQQAQQAAQQLRKMEQDYAYSEQAQPALLAAQKLKSEYDAASQPYRLSALQTQNQLAGDTATLYRARIPALQLQAEQDANMLRANQSYLSGGGSDDERIAAALLSSDPRVQAMGEQQQKAKFASGIKNALIVGDTASALRFFKALNPQIDTSRLGELPPDQQVAFLNRGADAAYQAAQKQANEVFRLGYHYLPKEGASGTMSAAETMQSEAAKYAHAAGIEAMKGGKPYADGVAEAMATWKRQFGAGTAPTSAMPSPASTAAGGRALPSGSSNAGAGRGGVVTATPPAPVAMPLVAAPVDNGLGDYQKATAMLTQADEPITAENIQRALQFIRGGGLEAQAAAERAAAERAAAEAAARLRAANNAARINSLYGQYGVQ
jgi:hypothetical protein